MSFEENNDDCPNTDQKSIPSKVKCREDKQILKCATPSVIRKGLCMVRDKGIWALYAKFFNQINLGGKMQKNVYGLACKATESAIKYGAEVATACDPVAAAIAVGGKIGVGASLSKFSASQCAGLIGVIVSSISPQVIKLYKNWMSPH